MIRHKLQLYQPIIMLLSQFQTQISSQQPFLSLQNTIIQTFPSPYLFTNTYDHEVPHQPILQQWQHAKCNQ